MQFLAAFRPGEHFNLYNKQLTFVCERNKNVNRTKKLVLLEVAFDELYCAWRLDKKNTRLLSN